MGLKIIHTEASTGWGGQEIRIFQECLGMARRGHRVIIAAPPGSAIYKRAKAAGIEVAAREFNKKSLGSYLGARAFIARERPDVLNTHSSSDSWVATIGAKLSGTGCRVIRTRHLSTPIKRSFSSRLIYELLPDAVMTTGEAIREQMIGTNGFSPARIRSIPTGVDLSRFDPAAVRPAFTGKGEFRIGVVGVLRNWKGHSYLLDAAPLILERIKEAFFYVAGDGPQEKNLKRLAASLKIEDRVEFLGHREDIPEVLASLDVVVHPSYESEGIPQSVLQALAMKRAVVASDAGAIREVVLDNETGLLIRPKDARLIADSVERLHKDPALRARLGERGREFVRRAHSFDAMLDRIEALYDDLRR